MSEPGTTTTLPEKLRELYRQDGCSDRESDVAADLINLLLELPPPPSCKQLYPEFTKLRDHLANMVDGDDAEAIEVALLELYCHLHGHEAPYTPAERSQVRETGGYWAHAGGISPLLKAGPYINERTVSADFGAGNGLQGLLLQKLQPHNLTRQVEISSRMVDYGRELQSWLEIPKNCVEWIVDDVLNVSAAGLDFIYLYRPVKPEGKGRRFYENLADNVSSANRIVTIFSIADCLREFLPQEFEVLYTDGHLTCYSNRPNADN